MKFLAVKTVVVLVDLFSGGCASTSSTPLPGAGDRQHFTSFRHPSTGDVQRCERAEWGWHKGVWDLLAADKCKSALEAQGYRRE